MIKLAKTLLLFSCFLALLGAKKAFAQAEKRNEVVKFGIGLRMVASSDVLSGGATTLFKEGVTFSYAPKLSFGIDAKIRFKLKNRFSFETGISSIRRAYNYSMTTDTVRFSGFLRQPSYQIPFLGILQVPISEFAKVGIEAGFLEEMIPGEIGNGGEEYYAFVYIKSRLKTSLRAGAHINFKTKSGSAIEAGFAYSRMLGRMGSFYMDYDPQSLNTIITSRSDLQGHFFSVSLAYFFP